MWTSDKSGFPNIDTTVCVPAKCCNTISKCHTMLCIRSRNTFPRQQLWNYSLQLGYWKLVEILAIVFFNPFCVFQGKIVTLQGSVVSLNDLSEVTGTLVHIFNRAYPEVVLRHINGVCIQYYISVYSHKTGPKYLLSSSNIWSTQR